MPPIADNLRDNYVSAATEERIIVATGRYLGEGIDDSLV